MNMKEDFNDIEFQKFIKEKAHKPGENPWFTRRVLNRLPEKESDPSAYSIEKWIYAISTVLCGLCWVYLFNTDFFDVITVRTLIYIVALIIGTIAFIIQAVRAILSY